MSDNVLPLLLTFEDALKKEVNTKHDESVLYTNVSKIIIF